MIVIYRWPLLSGKTREIVWLLCWKSSFLVFEIIIYQEIDRWPFLSSWKLEKVRSLQISESSLNFTCKRSHGGAKMNFDFAHWHFWPKLLSIHYSFTPQSSRGLRRRKNARDIWIPSIHFFLFNQIFFKNRINKHFFKHLFLLAFCKRLQFFQVRYFKL